MVTPVSPVEPQRVNGLEFDRMINPSKIDTLGVTGTHCTGSPLRAEPPADSVEKFNKLMSETPETRQAAGGNGTNAPAKDSKTIIKEYTDNLKKIWGNAEFQRKKNEAFPGGKVTDEQYGTYLFNIEQSVLQGVQRLQDDFKEQLKENQL